MAGSSKAQSIRSTFIFLQMTKLISKTTEVQSDLGKEIDNLHARMKKCEVQMDKNSKEIKSLDKKFTTELSKFNIKEEEKIPYVFTAPPRNRYFAGRTEEIQELKRILKVDVTTNEKKVRVAAVCGLGGIGKTSLVSEYAHRMKDYYKGGVYWFSAEDDTFLEKTVNDIALKIGALLGSFDLTSSNILKKIGSSSDPSLIVLDCVDQLDLDHSSNMMKLLSFPSQENIFGHFVILTRRKPSLLVNDVSVVEDNSCLEMKCFKSVEAKQFLLSRIGKARHDNVAESLCEELGRLPLALEQAGAYIQMCRCSVSSYLEQYKAEHLRLLRKQRSRPVSPGKQSPERLAVHTTWLMNLEYIKKSPDGQAAVRFINACSFLNGNEIEEELINIGTPEVEDDEYRKCVSLPHGRCQILKLLTDFSLFTFVQAHSVRTHRLVQELFRESFDARSKAESFTDAVRILSYAFCKCPSPSDLVSSHEMNGDEKKTYINELPNSRSKFYLWSKFCMHGHYLRKEMEDLLASLDSVQFPGTSKILYECAVHLSVNHKQEEAKRVLNFAYRTLDWLSSARYKTVKKILTNNSLFPLSIPLPKPVQIVIKECCMPPFASLQSLTGTPDCESSGPHLEKKIKKLRLNGNESFKEDRCEEALDAYSSALTLAQAGNISINPLLLTDRATVYIKLKRYGDALKDANDYIIRRPDCWRGYATKALALDGLNEKVTAEIAAALAFYHNRAIFSSFSQFKESFVSLQKRIYVCDSVDELQQAIVSQDLKEGELKILVLGSKEYIFNFGEADKPWNNCVLLGARKDRLVCLKPDHSINLLKSCALINLSISFNKGQLRCLRGSVVQMLNCNFSSDDVLSIVATEGKLNAEQCNFTNSNGSGMFCSGTGRAVVVNCSFCNSGMIGLHVDQGATLFLKSSRIHKNGLWGLSIISSKCAAINCCIDHNGEQGISIANSKNIKLIGNSVFGNNDNGICMVNSEVDISENVVFDNGLWGIWSQRNSQCNITLSRIFGNNAGGVCAGCRAEGFSPSVIETNKIYDNNGHYFLEGVSMFDVDNAILGLRHENLRKSFMKSPNALTSTEFHHNEVYNNKESEMIGKLNLSVPYCSNCCKKCDLEVCEKCFTAAYCGKSCQKQHFPKHERICKVLREKSSFLIRPERFDDGGGEVEYRKENSNVLLPRNRERFVVKVLPVTTMEKFNRLVLYNDKFRLQKTFHSKCIKELVKEFGVLCEQHCFDKKLFFYCVFEDKGQLRLFTNEFPEFQSW